MAGSPYADLREGRQQTARGAGTTAAGAGTLYGLSRLGAGPSKIPLAVGAARQTARQTYGLERSLGSGVKTATRVAGKVGARTLGPVGAGLLGGAALTGLGVAGVARGRSNQRQARQEIRTSREQRMTRMKAGNGVAVGKRLGVQPTLARRVPAAGRNGKRLTTGQQKNVNAIIGKAKKVDLASRLAGHVGTAQPRPDLRRALAGAEPKSRLTEAAHGKVKKAAPGTNGLGHAVPQHVGASIKPQVPEQMGNALKPAGGSKKNPAQAGGARMPRQNGGQRPTSFGKRRYDPEDERRHQQGALAATGMIGGAALTHRGVRDIRTDTRRAQQRGQSVKDLYPVRPPQHESGLGWPKARSNEEKGQRALGRQQAFERESELYSRHQRAVRSLRKPPALNGAVVTRRAGGKVGAGLALLGAGGALQVHRREPRWD